MSIALAAALFLAAAHAAPPKTPSDPAKDLQKALESAQAALKQMEASQNAVDSLLNALGAPNTAPTKTLVREAAPNFVVIPEGTNELLMLKPDAKRIARIAEKNKKLPAKRQIKYRVLSGKVVVVDFWGAWCKPCLQALPDLSSIQKDYRARGVEVVGIAIGTEAKDMAKAVKTCSQTLAHDNVAEPAQEAYSVEEFPTLVVIDRQGRVVTRESGWGGHSAKELRALLDKVLAEKP